VKAQSNNSQIILAALSLQRELEKRGWALAALSDAANTLAHANSTELLVQGVCEAIASQGPYVLAWVGQVEKDEAKTVKVIGAAGRAVAYIADIVVSWSASTATGRGPAGICIRNNCTSIVKDAKTDPGFEAWRERASEFGIRSAIACPIPDDIEGVPIGVLLVYSSTPNIFAASEVQLFESLAKEIGFGLRSIDRQHKLDDQIHQKEQTQRHLAMSLKATIEAMSKTMEWRDPYTAGHQKGVAAIARMIARELKWSSERIQALYMAAMVHDIGKVAVPSEILTKPSRLTDLEMQMVQGHVEAGYQILKDIPFPWPIAEMVHQHHERLDGSGYPKGLHGDQICEEARVLAVADTIEAMATHRPYRPAKGLGAAMEEIKAQAGTKLDARVVDAAVTLFGTANDIEQLLHGQ
jgi:putative nucleotidyltransferase with HDIG domain